MDVLDLAAELGHVSHVAVESASSLPEPPFCRRLGGRVERRVGSVAERAFGDGDFDAHECAGEWDVRTRTAEKMHVLGHQDPCMNREAMFSLCL